MTFGIVMFGPVARWMRCHICGRDVDLTDSEPLRHGAEVVRICRQCEKDGNDDE